MKRIASLALVSTVLFASCKKAFEQPEDYSSFAVIHASPVSSTTPTDTLHVFVDTAMYTSSGATYLGNTTYLPILSGTKTVNIRRKANKTSDLYVAPITFNFEKGGAYSFFVYDTTTSSAGQAKVLKLKDDLTLPAADRSHVRFLHLAPNGPAVDVTLVRTSATPNDSVTISNRSYIGAAPNEAALAPFQAVPRGTYTVRMKAAGTGNVLSTTTGVLLTTGLNVTEGRIVTLFAAGTAKGRPLTLGSFRHY